MIFHAGEFGMAAFAMLGSAIFALAVILLLCVIEAVAIARKVRARQRRDEEHEAFGDYPFIQRSRKGSLE